MNREKELRDLFETLGEVINTKVFMNSFGKSKVRLELWEWCFVWSYYKNISLFANCCLGWLDRLTFDVWSGIWFGHLLNQWSCSISHQNIRSKRVARKKNVHSRRSPTRETSTTFCASTSSGLLRAFILSYFVLCSLHAWNEDAKQCANFCRFACSLYFYTQARPEPFPAGPQRKPFASRTLGNQIRLEKPAGMPSFMNRFIITLLPKVDFFFFAVLLDLNQINQIEPKWW